MKKDHQKDRRLSCHDRDLNFRKDRDRDCDSDFGDRANALSKSGNASIVQ